MVLVRVATVVDDSEEEDAPLRGRQHRRGIDCRLNQYCRIELGGERGAHTRQRLARVDFLDDRLLGSAPFGDVDGAADESEELAVGAEPRRPRDDRPARLALVWLQEPAFEVKRTALIRGVEHRVGSAPSVSLRMPAL